ncbi:MAG TPA: hypothetical protein VEI02_02810 [Planctomycetota bacterium]|nr:hypothetical protein [Planctomycetota bacterium]
MKLPTLRRSRERGAALPLALVYLFVTATFVVTLLGAVDNERKGVSLQVDRTQGWKLAEGVLQVGENVLLDQVSNYRPLATPTAAGNYVVLTGSHAYGGLDGTWSAARATDTSGPVPVLAPPTVRVDPSGLQTLVTPYVITAVVRNGDASTTLRRHIELEQTPIFQFLAFYASDLEVLPGPAMTLGGRVHTNENLYLGAGTSLTLDTKYVRAAGKLHRHRKDDNSVQSGWIKIKNQLTSTLVTLQSQSNLAASGIGSTYGLDSDFNGWEINGDNQFTSPGEMPPFKIQAANQFGGTLGTGDMGVKKLQHPSIGAIDAFTAVPGGTGGDYVQTTPGNFVAVTPGTGTHAQGYYHDNAGLVVRNSQVFNTAGVNITALMPSGFLATRTMWDQREGKTVTLTQINLNRLKDMDGVATTIDPCPYFPADGLLYAYRTDTTSTTGSGIVLSGGSELNAGLTVVSPAPVYVHGNFNTVNKKPAAVICDTAHLLSSAWNWTNSSTSGLKIANSTTYNLAFIAGNKNTTAGAYNGGFENFPRFHENWTGKVCTIKGSFVNTWTSKIHTGNWVYGGNHYTAPDRNWTYESNFDDTAQLPPFTPMAVSTRAVAFEMSQ